MVKWSQKYPIKEINCSDAVSVDLRIKMKKLQVNAKIFAANMELAHWK